MIPGTDGECPGFALGMRLEPSSESRRRKGRQKEKKGTAEEVVFKD
jgi:hypothetical protein